MIMPIYLYGAGVFNDPVARITRFNDKLVGLIRSMFETLHNGNGIGLAAIQVGVPISLFLMDISDPDERADEKPVVVINPEVLESTGERVMNEGCLSIPGIWEEVARADKIRVRFTDGTFNTVEMEFEDSWSRVFQHEYDHLHQKFFVDRLSGVKRQLLKPKLSKIKKGDSPARYPVVSARAERMTRKRELAEYDLYA